MATLARYHPMLNDHPGFKHKELARVRCPCGTRTSGRAAAEARARILRPELLGQP